MIFLILLLHSWEGVFFFFVLIGMLDIYWKGREREKRRGGGILEVVEIVDVVEGEMERVREEGRVFREEAEKLWEIEESKESRGPEDDEMIFG